MKFSIEFVDFDPKRNGKALEGAAPEIWLARRLAEVLPKKTHLKLVLTAKEKRLKFYRSNGRFAWKLPVTVTPPTDSAGQPNRRIAIGRRSYSYHDPDLPKAIARYRRPK